MPKPLLKKIEQTSTDLISATKTEAKTQTVQMDKMKLERLLRKSRSKEYMKALQQLDAGGHVQNKEAVDTIINAIQNEFPEIELSAFLIGFVAKCYLGKPYEVHTLDMTGSIIEHYKAGSPLPNGMEKARSLAYRGGYEFIEVYSDCCRAISSNGAVSVIPG